MIFWLDEKLASFLRWKHKKLHKPQCTPMREGIPYKCNHPNCGTEWISAWDSDKGDFRWQELPNDYGQA